MRHTKYSAVFCAALGIYAFPQVPALAQAGFDCGKASTAMEKAICSKPDIAEADRAMSIAYSALIERADPALKEALRNDQSAFIKIRAEAFESNLSNLENRLTGLLDRTDMRAEFLNWISVTDNSSLEGNWSNAWGAIEVEKKPSGQLAVNVNVADQANGTWVCSFEGVIEQKSAGEAEFKGEGGPLVLRLEGATLNIPTPFCDESTSGGFGTAAGTYFRVGAP
ncbi:DUF1311 domain-containing protein [Ochrobactrum sp. MYb15]|uniref:lysozyme inhibitor LprI family protein n=1 Tax=Brucella TaxID=234 RepID=UPI00046351CA|nr:lysozyme inhibitor LprI family protein [Brucella rhizosphaerae]PQZ47460.1 DUF1311 domain-containing protein [Ochrobactrum sp. MYb19]PRA62148.1 DUF1311 domain-containing protein [Ochrobactrum sp. MYb18]PRA77447.1 DUF1311 domain-containing protein [Brucella thiophenivorans]PRA87512.1 DUF1311 domain-containing protein [Ochrobactrum sp. MYb14]PRA99457.1 DUF1311 domain-containing protein [Ochrobactrum sp. MYb15]